MATYDVAVNICQAHVNQRILNPRFMSQKQTYDVGSNTWQALPIKSTTKVPMVKMGQNWLVCSLISCVQGHSVPVHYEQTVR